MAFIGASVALLIGIMIISQVSDTIVCPANNDQLATACQNAKDTAWTVIGILPIALFFAMFAIFGGIGGDGIGNPLGFIKNIHIRGKKSIKIKTKLSISQKIMVMLGLAKVKNIE